MVFGLAEGCLGTLVTCAAEMLAPAPNVMSHESAASMPTVFITAQLAMQSAAAIAAGDTVLVHGGTGGVGLAALQVIGAAGATAAATAGSPSKRALLRSLGCAAVVGSRDTGFAAQLAQLGGVAVVLNSLTSPGMVAASLAALLPGGRLVEIGKRDIWSPAAAAAERPDVSYSLLAVDFLPAGVVQAALRRVAAGAATGQLRPLPTITHDLRSVVAALRQLSQVLCVCLTLDLGAGVPSTALLCRAGGEGRGPAFHALHATLRA
jgi:NADPH:quinone reductase-like Zn-dependent oxidoreductase